MSTVTEIECAIAQLPPEKRVEIRRWMDAQLEPTNGSTGVERVDWSQSAAVKRARPSEERVDANVVLEVLREARE